MRVRAIPLTHAPNLKYVGFYGNKRIKVGDEFEINEKHFSEKWMEKVEQKKAATPSSSKK